MANVMFKRGLSTALPWNNAQDGAFYLTSDTNRLYVGNGTTLAELNRYVKTVQTVNDLSNLNAHENDFAYILDKNILAVYAPNKDNSNVLEWHQVNVNTNTDTSVTEVSFTDGTVVDAADGREKSIKIDMTLTQKNKDVLTGVTSDAGSITQSFYIPASAFSTMETNAAVTATVSVSDGVATIKNTGTGAAGEGFTVSGGENISISGDAAGITIASSDTTYNVNVEGTEISLIDSNQNQSTTRVSIVGDNDWIQTSNVNGNITVAHASKTVSKPETVKGGELTENIKFTVITRLDVDDHNHVTGIDTTEYEAKDTTYTPGLALSSNKGLVVSLTNQDDSTVSAASLDISHKITIDGQEYNVKPGDNLGEIYSKGEIDRQLRALNGMTYKGVVNSESELPDVAHIGDTYKVGTAFDMSINGITTNLKVGDLLIVNNSDENDDGQITADISWDRIESGEAADTTYNLTATNNSIILTDSHGTTDIIPVSGDEIITLTASDNELTAAHKEYDEATATDGGDETVGAGKAFTAVTSIATDGFGHTTGYTTKDFTIPGTDKVTADASLVKLTLKDANDAEQGSIVLEEGEELTVTGTSTDNKNLVATIAHNKVTKNDTTGTATPDHGTGTFKVVESVTYNDYGHVTGVKTTTVALPAETTYSIHGATAANNIATWELKNNSDAVMGNPIAITSGSLKIATNASSQATIELEWGSF